MPAITKTVFGLQRTERKDFTFEGIGKDSDKSVGIESLSRNPILKSLYDKDMDTRCMNTSKFITYGRILGSLLSCGNVRSIKHRQATIANLQLNPPPPISEYPGPDQKQAFVTFFDSIDVDEIESIATSRKMISYPLVLSPRQPNPLACYNPV